MQDRTKTEEAVFAKPDGTKIFYPHRTVYNATEITGKVLDKRLIAGKREMR